MKANGTYVRKVINESGNYEVTFEIADYPSKKAVEELEKQVYSLEIKKPRSKRSLSQNALLWKLIGCIAHETREKDIDIYVNILVDCGAKYEILKVFDRAEDSLKKAFRFVQKLNYDNENKEYAFFKCFYGSSTFNTKEMTELIDKAIEYCHNLDIVLEGAVYETL